MFRNWKLPIKFFNELILLLLKNIFFIKTESDALNLNSYELVKVTFLRSVLLPTLIRAELIAGFQNTACVILDPKRDLKKSNPMTLVGFQCDATWFA